MCIAIVKTKNGTISDEYLKNCWNRNKDGAGFAYPKHGEVVIEKGFFNYDQFLKRFREVEKKIKNNMLIHFRISTAGLIDKNNCHPHRINNKLAMIHNGILDIDVPAGSKVSDTVLYCQKYLKQLPKNFYMNSVIMEYMEECIGGGNKFCFLDSDGKYAIVNEKAGHWKDGVWYSNTSYEGYKYTTKYTNEYWNWGKSSTNATEYDDEDWWGDYYGYKNEECEFGFGDIHKWYEDSYITPAERQTLINDPDLYDAIWDNLDEYADAVNEYQTDDCTIQTEDTVFEMINAGEDPRVVLLSGRLCNEYDIKDTSNNLTEVNTIPLSEYDTEAYRVYQDYYNTAYGLMIAVETTDVK